MAQCGKVISIGSDSEPEIVPVYNTRSKTRGKKPKQNKVAAKQAIQIDLTEPETQSSQKKILLIENDLNIEIDDESDDELEENVRVIWTKNVSEIKRFPLKPSQTLQLVFKDFSENYNIPIENIGMRKNEKIISMYDTLKSLELKFTEYLEAYEIEGSNDNCKKSNPDNIKIKCLLQNLKKPLIFYLHPNQSFSSLLSLCAKEMNCSVNKVGLRFDGEKIKPEDTPSSIELEDGECLDVYVI